MPVSGHRWRLAAGPANGRRAARAIAPALLLLGLSGVCAYSPASRTWLPHQQAVAEPERLDPDRGW